jgi:hypothetical protein
MTRRIHAVALNVVLGGLAAFYLFSPTVYAYFSEVSMVYSHVPAWFASTPPAHLTARIFDRYNVNAPRALRFQQKLSCFLIGPADRGQFGCTHALGNGATVSGPTFLKIPSGQYVARFEFSSNTTCNGPVRIDVLAAGRFGHLLADYSGPIPPDRRIELPFRLRMMAAALGTVEFRVTGLGECAVLTRADWREASAAERSWASPVTPDRPAAFR